MNNREIGIKLDGLIRGERKFTNEILEMINLAQERRAYLDLGFSSMFDWLVRGFGYSNAAAYRRIEAAKVLRAVPEVAWKLEAGNVNLSTVSQVQKIVKAQEKWTGKKVSIQQKAELIAKIENKSVPEAEQTLFAIFPEAASTVHQDRRTVVNGSTTRVSINLSKEGETDLNRAREVLSHKIPNGRDADIVAYALKFLLDKTDPLRKISKPSLPSKGFHQKKMISITKSSLLSTTPKAMTQTASSRGSDPRQFQCGQSANCNP